MILIFVVGAALCTGAYTTCGLHLPPPVNPNFVEHASTIQCLLGALLVLVAGASLIVAPRTDGTKYFEITPVPARHFKRQFFYNGNILTVVDGNLSYAWLLNKREDEMFKKRWSDEGVLFLKKYYDKNKKLRYTILMFDL